MSVNQAGAFVRSRPELQRPNLHIYFNPASYSTTTIGSRRRLINPDPYPGFLMSFNTCRPTSRGSIHIRSPDPLEPPAIAPNSLSTPRTCRTCSTARGCCGASPRPSALAARHRGRARARRGGGQRLPGAGGLPRPRRLGVPRQRHLRDGVGSAHRGASMRTCACAASRGCGSCDASVFPNVTSGNTNAATHDAGREGRRPDSRRQRRPRGVTSITMQGRFG